MTDPDEALRLHLHEASRSEERWSRLLAEGRRISADAAALWPAALRDVDHGELLYDEEGLAR